MKTYLFDASAAVELYAPRNKKVAKITQYIASQRKTYKQATLHIPNFCIVEVFNVLGRMYFEEKKLTRKKYQQCLANFRKDIHWATLLYPYDLNRYHILAADEIIPIEHHVSRRKERDYLSAFDILLIAMACELAFIGQPEDVYLVTCDKRIQIVCDEFRSISDKERQSWKEPRSAMDEPDQWRWYPPSVLYLPTMLANEISPVLTQPQLKL